MATDEINLLAPNSLPIIGIKLKDGSVSEFQYSHDAKTQTSLYALPEGRAADTCSPTVLIDSAGNEWNAGDVEFHSLTRRK